VLIFSANFEDPSPTTPPFCRVCVCFFFNFNTLFLSKESNWIFFVIFKNRQIKYLNYDSSSSSSSCFGINTFTFYFCFKSNRIIIRVIMNNSNNTSNYIMIWIYVSFFQICDFMIFWFLLQNEKIEKFIEIRFPSPPPPYPLFFDYIHYYVLYDEEKKLKREVLQIYFFVSLTIFANKRGSFYRCDFWTMNYDKARYEALLYTFFWVTD